MKNKNKIHSFLKAALLSFVTLALLSVNSIAAETQGSDPNQSSKYLDAVRQFADNVLAYGRDTYGPKHTPLFVDGLMVRDPNDPNYGADGVFKPVEWIAPNGDRWVLSNLASQQNLFRTLDGLSAITGDPKYRQAAMEAIEYTFENLRSPNGLLYWGGHQAYDAAADTPCGRAIHELKVSFPYYELIWRVNPQATKQFIEAFWSAHILDWSHLEMNRHGSLSDSLAIPWRHEYEEDGLAFEYTSDGYSSISAGSDLVYAAAWLTMLSGDEESLVWSRRLARRYVKTRHSETGISYWCYTRPREAVRESYDDVMKKLMLGTNGFPISEFPWSTETNPIARECCRGYVMSTPGISLHWQLFIWQSQFLIGEMLGKEGDEFKQWALEELTAFGKASYRKEDNVYVPILTDGTNLEGYLVKEDSSLLGPKGVILKSLPAGPSDFWAYAMAYRVTSDEFMWEMAHSIAKGNEFGDIGVTLNDEPQLKTSTDCSNPYALLAFLELHRVTGRSEFLEMAKRIGDNILTNRFHKGFFVASSKHIYTKFDAIDSLALLHLHSELVEGISTVPEVWPSKPFFEVQYRKKDITIDNQIIYTLTESDESPMSLQEAAAIGDIDLVRSITEKGTEVDSREDGFYKTALHRAVISGHKDVVGFLLAKGADIDAGDSGCKTPLHYAVEEGHREIAELLIAKGADVNIKNNEGFTPLHCVAMRPRPSIPWWSVFTSREDSIREMAELLICSYPKAQM
jgi:pectate lyase